MTLPLSPRQARLISLVEAGRTNAEIMHAMGFRRQSGLSMMLSDIRHKGVDFEDNRRKAGTLGRPMGVDGWYDESPRIARLRNAVDVAQGRRCKHCHLLLLGERCDCPRAVRDEERR